MAVSNYKLKTQKKINQLLQDLITDRTGFTQLENPTNFKIAEDYCQHSLANHTFLDTDENKLRRSFAGTLDKFSVHNQSQIASRLSYLEQMFRRMPLKQEGISNSHDSMLHLLLLLADQPTGPDGFNRMKMSKRKYFTKAEAGERSRKRMEVKI